MNRIITIGREFGSGGRELGRRLADALEIAYYDQEIVTEIANRTALSEAYVHQILEHRPISAFPIRIGRTLHPVPGAVQQQSADIFRQQCDIRRKMADTSDCVIVGRCADYLLRSRKPFRIFVYADMESRIRRCREKGPEHEGLTDRELRQHILSVDRNRAESYRHYTGRKWGDRLNYDLCVNTSDISPRDAAAAISRLLR